MKRVRVEGKSGKRLLELLKHLKPVVLDALEKNDKGFTNCMDCIEITRILATDAKDVSVE